MTTTTVDPATTGVRARPGVARVVRHSLLMTRRNLLYFLRGPQMIVFTVVQPIMFLVLFNYVFGGTIDRGGGYLNFLIPGIIVQFASFAAFSTAMGLNADMNRGVIDRFKSLPIARSAVLTGRILADAVGIAFNILLLGGVGFLMGFRTSASIGALAMAFVIATAFGIAMARVGGFIGLSLKTPEAVQSGGMIWLFPLTFASSAFAPTETMPGWLQAFVRANPVTVTADALRALANSQPAATLVVQSLAWSAGIILVFFSLAVRRYRRLQ